MANQLVDEIAAAVPSVPRSSVEQILRLAEERRVREAPSLRDAPLSNVLALIAGTSMTLSVPGGAEGSLSRIGDQAALEIIGSLRGAGVRLMLDPAAKPAG